MTVYAVGDLHGHMAQLTRALDLIARDGGARSRIVFLGDFVDRGPDSRAVISTLRAGVEARRDWICLRGNHDRMLSQFWHEGIYHDSRVKSGKCWFNTAMGGAATLASYGVENALAIKLTTPMPGGCERIDRYGDWRGYEAAHRLWQATRETVPEEDIAFIDSRPLYHTQDGMIFVHAGLRPGVALEDQVEDDLVWIREPFLNHPFEFGAVVVHGHTVVERAQNLGYRIAMDTGAGYGRPVTVGVFENGGAWVLTDSGRQAFWS